MLKIATILPYKENYSTTKAAAASLWVYDFFRHSTLKKKQLHIWINRCKRLFV